jgi:copper chaperone CopZ
MKKFILILCISFSLTSQAQITKATLQASGLTCALCSKAVYNALSSISFVDKVKANIELSTFDLTFKPGNTVDLDALSKAVVNAGFSVSLLKVNNTFHAAKVQNDSHVMINDHLFHFINVSPQTIDGERMVTLVDKNFVSAKDYKKYGKLTTLKCYESGLMDGKRVYHVTI